MIEQIWNATAVENGEEATEKREGDIYPYMNINTFQWRLKRIEYA